MKKIIKGVATTFEYGDWDNFVTVIPEKISLNRISDRIFADIDSKSTYGMETNFTQDNIEEIDFESFGTTLEAELNKIGFEENEVQFYGEELYVIKNEDGTITPFEDFKAEFDYKVMPYGYIEHKIVTHKSRGEEKFLRYVNFIGYDSKFISNLKIEKVEG